MRVRTWSLIHFYSLPQNVASPALINFVYRTNDVDHYTTQPRSRRLFSFRRVGLKRRHTCMLACVTTYGCPASTQSLYMCVVSHGYAHGSSSHVVATSDQVFLASTVLQGLGICAFSRFDVPCHTYIQYIHTYTKKKNLVVEMMLKTKKFSVFFHMKAKACTRRKHTVHTHTFRWPPAKRRSIFIFASVGWFFVSLCMQRDKNFRNSRPRTFILAGYIFQKYRSNDVPLLLGFDAVNTFRVKWPGIITWVSLWISCAL